MTLLGREDRIFTISQETEFVRFGVQLSTERRGGIIDLHTNLLLIIPLNYLDFKYDTFKADF